MYAEFYGFRDLPFQLTPDPRFFFESTVHKRAEAHLLFGLSQGEGFIIVTGDVGAGKTTLVGRLLATLDPKRFVAAKIVSSQLGADDMLRMVANAFGLAFEGADKATLLKRIENFLMSNHRRGLRTLLLVDEAQNLSIAALEELRMLSNYQIGRQAPMQSFLLAQPQFRRILASKDLDQLRQRVIASYHLGPMNAEETSEYVRHRLRLVGWRNDPELPDDALAEVFRHTGGVPRMINTLCSRLLLFGVLEETHQLDRKAVEQVAEDLRGETEQVLDHSELPAAVKLDLQDDAALGEFQRRIELLEARVRTHDRALRQMVQLAVDNLPPGA